jgi:hypothetical protein
MRVEMLSIADFYSNVDEVRAFAMQQEFVGEESHFPGKRTKSFLNDSVKEVIQSTIRPFAGDVTWWGDQNSGAFQYTTAADRSWIHSDGNTDWAGVLYLTPDAPLSSGTGIFKHKATGLRNWIYKDHITEEDKTGVKGAPHRGADSVDYTKWDMVDRIGNMYNRLIMYRGDLFHVSLDYFGKDLQTGRLFQTFFFNTEK